MIIATYAGVGKSSFANMYPDKIIDLCSMPFSWILPENEMREYENIKAALYLLRNPLFPDNYIAAILEAEDKYDYVLIPAIKGILERLHNEYFRPYILCYPDISLKHEYEKRYLNRGNSEDFLGIFIDQWDDRILDISYDNYGIHIPLQAKEYLSDAKPRIDAAVLQFGHNTMKDREWLLSLTELRETIKCRATETCMWFCDNYGQDYFYPFDINNAETRKMIFNIGKILYENEIVVRTSIPYQFWVRWQEDVSNKHDCLKKSLELHSKEVLMEVIAKMERIDGN